MYAHQPAVATPTKTSAALQAEPLLKQVTQTLRSETNLQWYRGFDAPMVAKRLGLNTSEGLVGVYPDGGIWTDVSKRNLLVASEAKQQGCSGNAIERWYKNEAMLMALGTQIYVTFCTGPGFFNNHRPQRILEASAAVLNRPHQQPAGKHFWNTPSGSHWFYRWHTQPTATEIRQILETALQKTGAHNTDRTTAERS